MSRRAWIFALALSLTLLASVSTAHRIAIIGGGISGSFTAKYLMDYDSECQLEVTVFEPKPTTRPVATSDSPDDDWQGSRVSSLRLDDGTIVELGASIGHKEGFALIVEMADGDPAVEIGERFNTGGTKVDEHLRKGLGIYNGDGEWKLLTSQSGPGFLNTLRILYRYNYDLFRVSRYSKQAEHSFKAIHYLLASDHPDTFFDSPDDIWQAVGLHHLVHASFDEVLDSVGVGKAVSWWRWLLPYQGVLRNELLAGINLVNYNQDNSQVNGLVGLSGFATTTGDLFSIRGGNYKVIESALKQANETSQRRCEGSVIQHVPKRVTTVVGALDGLTLYADQDVLGTFDVVILATPLQQSRIEFLVQSHMDEAVLQPMPLAGLINTDEQQTEEGHTVLPPQLPDSAIRPYTQVITTIVSNATLNAEYFSLPEEDLPRSVCMTTDGKGALFNITAISQITSTGIFKVFSNNKLDEVTLKELFGEHYRLEYVKSWGGPHGGATPDYQGQGAATNFMLYDGAAGLGGHTKSGAMFYPPAMEQSSLACMEVSAVGAKAVAKLIAKRLGLIKTRAEAEVRDEL